MAVRCRLPNRRTLLISLIVSIAVIYAVRMVTFTSVQLRAPKLRHALTVEEKNQLESQFRSELQRKHEKDVKRIEEEAKRTHYELSQLLQDARDRGDTSRVEELQTEIQKHWEDLESTITKLQKDHEQNLEGLVSQKLLNYQAQLIQKHANLLLDYLCSLSEEELESDPDIFNVEDSEVDFGEQPCVGVASDDNPVVEPSIYYTTDPEVAKKTAASAHSWLKNTTDEYSNTVLNSQSYELSNDDRCCDKLYFMVHPVFGAFYRYNMPVRSPKSSGNDPDLRAMCYRRRWYTKPSVKPVSRYSNVEHLYNPSNLLLPPKPKKAQPPASGRRLQDSNTKTTKPKFPAGTVHMILPFKGDNLDLLPNLIKSVSRAKRFSSKNEGTPMRLIISPARLSREGVSDTATVQSRLENIVKAADQQANGLNVTLAQPIKAENMNAKALLGWARSWLLAEAKDQGVTANTKNGQRRLRELRRMLEDSEDGSNAAGTGVEDILPSDWLAAVLGGLKHVPRANSIVLILDSATLSVPESIARKTTWRVMAGRQVFSPVPMSTDQLQPVIDASGSVSDLSVPSVPATDKSFYKNTQTVDASADARRLRAVTRRALQEDKTEAPVDDDFGVSDNWLFDDDNYYTEYAPTDDYEFGAATDDWADFYDDDFAGLAYDDDDLDAWEYDYNDYYGEYTDDYYGDAGFWFRDDDMYGEDDEFYYEEDFYYDDDFWEDESHLSQTQRSTTLGLAKADFAGAVYRMIKTALHRKPLKAIDVNDQAADDCIARRLLAQLKRPYVTRNVKDLKTKSKISSEDGTIDIMTRRPLKIVRTRPVNFYVGFPAESTLSETYPCECDYSSWIATEYHCATSFPMTSVDDLFDNKRVSCAVSEMLQDRMRKAGVKPTAPSSDKALNVDMTKVKVTHGARFIDPSSGVEIVAKVLPYLAKDSGRRLQATSGLSKPSNNGASSGKPVGPEVFSFRWDLGPRVIEVEPVDTDDDSSFWFKFQGQIRNQPNGFA